MGSTSWIIPAVWVGARVSRIKPPHACQEAHSLSSPRPIFLTGRWAEAWQNPPNGSWSIRGSMVAQGLQWHRARYALRRSMCTEVIFKPLALSVPFTSSLLTWCAFFKGGIEMMSWVLRVSALHSTFLLRNSKSVMMHTPVFDTALAWSQVAHPLLEQKGAGVDGPSRTVSLGYGTMEWP